MDIFHSTWFWVVVIGAPLVSVIGTLARLAHKEPPIKLPPGVVPQPYKFDDEEEGEDDDWGQKPAPAAGEEKNEAKGPKKDTDRPR
nr:hypothetical protein [uncultured Pseudogulbenkiania sp.]